MKTCKSEKWHPSDPSSVSWNLDIRPFFGYSVKGRQSFLFIRCLIDCLQIYRERFSVFLKDIFQNVSQLMDNAALIFRLWKGGCNGFFHSGQSIGTKNQDIFYTVIFQFFQNSQTVFRPFVIANLDRTSFLPSILIPKITQAANFRITPLSRTEQCIASIKRNGYTSSKGRFCQSSIQGRILSATSEIKPSDVSNL